MKTRRMIVMLLCVVVIAGMMTGCQKKIPQTAAEFTQIMETAGLAVRDNTGNGDENDKLTAKLYAIDENYTIEYYAFEDSGAAQRVYNSNYRTFDEENPVKTLSAKMTTRRGPVLCDCPDREYPGRLRCGRGIQAGDSEPY